MVSAPRRARRRGFTLIEFLVASSLASSVVLMSSMAIANGEKSLTRSRNRDQAVLIATEVLAKTALLNCGFGILTGTNGTSAPSTIRSDCENEFSRDGETERSFTSGDFSFTRGRYQVAFTTRWRQYSARSTVCAAVDDSGTTGGLADGEKYQPSLLVVAVAVTWTDFGVQRTFRSYAVRAAPNTENYRNLGTGSLIVRAPAGTRVTLTDGIDTVARAADENGCAWFPFLPFGAAGGNYTYSTGGAGLEVSLSATTPKVVS